MKGHKIEQQHYIMLSRKLVYTGLTRAKKLAIIIGSQKAIAIAVKQRNERQRYTRSSQRLMTRLGRLRDRSDEKSSI
jgi:exodeoxyribonuclease V alpha subunit